jgi:hypothetical protein
MPKMTQKEIDARMVIYGNIDDYLLLFDSEDHEEEEQAIIIKRQLRKHVDKWYKARMLK